MRYFTYMAEQSFKAGPDGEHLFYLSVHPWSKPYIIPDDATKQKMYWKLVWVLRLLLGGMIFVPPILSILLPNLIDL